MSRWFEKFRDFRRNERGNIALLFGLSLIPMAGAAGVAIDYGQASNMRTALQADVDATALDIVKAAVDIHTDLANASMTPAQRQALVDTKAAQIVSARRPISQARIGSGSNFAFTGEWADGLKTEYKVTAQVAVKRHVRVLSSETVTPVATAATAKMQYQGTLTTAAPTMTNPGYEAGDYNRIYAYCYNKNEPVVANRRTKMTVVSSNGTHGNGGPAEMTTNPVFSNISMPVCDADKGETLSWRLYNVRGQRTTPGKWPADSASYNPPSNYTPATDKGGVTIYNHYSDTLIDPVTGVESYQFRGDAFGHPQPIKMMETFVCDTQTQCTPGPGSTIPSEPTAPYNMPKNRNPSQSGTKCEPGKFMYIGWEDRPFLPIDAGLNNYSTSNSQQWTDSDYDDIRLVISCPSTTITGYTSKIMLIK